MMRLLVFGFLILGPSLSQANLPVSPSGFNGIMTYTASVFMPKAQEEPVGTLINEQSKFLLGIFEEEGFAKLNSLPSNDKLGVLALGNLLGFKILDKIPTPDGTGWDVSYTATHRILMRKDVLPPNSTRQIKIIVPHNPLNFYVRACTDKKYYEKEYIFYYWNPFTKICQPHLIGKNRVDIVDARIQSLDTGVSSVRPDYIALRRQIQNRGELKIGLLFGFDQKYSDPNDEGRLSFEYFQRFFEKHCFTIDHHRNTPTGPFIDYIRPANQNHYALRIQMSLSASDQNSPIVFSRRAREAFETADIILYVGHSGLGGNLDIDKLAWLSSPDRQHPEPIHFPNAYQVYFIDSCASYFFYSDEYALAKKGLRHADIVTNGLASFFYTQNRETLEFLDPFTNVDTSETWTDILSGVESASTARHFTYLVNVLSVR